MASAATWQLLHLDLENTRNGLVCVKGKKLSCWNLSSNERFCTVQKREESGTYENSQSRITFSNEDLVRQQPTVRQEPSEGDDQAPGSPHFLLRQISIQHSDSKPTVLRMCKEKLNRVCRCVWRCECCMLLRAQAAWKPEVTVKGLLSLST